MTCHPVLFLVPQTQRLFSTIFSTGSMESQRLRIQWIISLNVMFMGILTHGSKSFKKPTWSVSISTQNWRRRIRKGSELRDLHTGTWRCQKDEQLFLNETQYGSKRSFTFVAKNGFNGMGRWTMHEFRLDGLYGNTANYVRLLIFLILFNIHSNALFLDFLDALFLDFLWKLFLCLYIWGLYLSPSL